MTLAHELNLPHPPLLRRVARMSVMLWLVVRVAYVLVLLMAVSFFRFLSPEEGIDAALHPVWPSRALLVMLTCFLVWLQRRNANEHLLQFDFGVRPIWFLATSVVAAGAADVVVQALIGSL